MAGRKIRDEKDARRCMAAAMKAGLNEGDWARSHGIDGRSLFAWSKNLARGDHSRGGKRLAPKARRRKPKMVELVSSGQSESARYVVRCGKLTVEFDERFDEGTLARVLKIVAAC